MTNQSRKIAVKNYALFNYGIAFLLFAIVWFSVQDQGESAQIILLKLAVVPLIILAFLLMQTDQL